MREVRGQDELQSQQGFNHFLKDTPEGRLLPQKDVRLYCSAFGRCCYPPWPQFYMYAHREKPERCYHSVLRCAVLSCTELPLKEVHCPQTCSDLLAAVIAEVTVIRRVETQSL